MNDQEKDKCSVCNITVVNQELSDKHGKEQKNDEKIKQSHNKTDGQIKCNLCNITVGTGKMLETRVKTKVKEQKQTKKQQTVKCDICNLTVSSEVVLAEHCKGKKHIRLEEQKKIVDNKIACGVFIKGFRYDTPKDVILTYFAKFGEFKMTHFGPRNDYLILEYSTSSSVDRILNKKKHTLNDRQLLVSRRTLPQHQLTNQVAKQLEQEEDDTAFINTLKNVTGLDEQIARLFTEIQPNFTEKCAQYNQICYDMGYILQSVFPYCEVCPFGSTITGLQFKNSDLDIYINKAKRQKDDDVECLKLARKVLYRNQTFKNIIVIPNAKIPILKCVHSRTNINCDVNFRNMLGVCNSKLIRFYLSLDEKIKVIMYLLKYWGKIHGITGRNHLFTNYSLIMMFIFYLQQDPFRLPSVETLQRNSKFWNIQDLWNGGFQPIPYNNKAMRNAKFVDLLHGFFKFYSEFQYSIEIICPFLGKSLKKSDFAGHATIPAKFVAYKANLDLIEPLKADKPICMQDPFEHSRNTTFIIVPNTLDTFISLCKLGKEITGVKSEESMLFNLFTQKLKTAVVTKKINPDLKIFSIQMGHSLKYLKPKSESLDQNEIRKLWFDEMLDIINKTLKDVLRFEIDKKNNGNKFSKLDEQKDVHDLEPAVTYICSGFYNTWSDRKAGLKLIDAKKELSWLEKEIAVTDNILRTTNQVDATELLLKFEIEICLESEPNRVTIKLSEKESIKKLFRVFAAFFSSKFPSWFQTHENELNKT